MSQMTPDPYQPVAPGFESAPPPVPYWAQPPPPPPPPPPTRGEPHLWRWIVVSFLVAAIAAGGSGVGVGWGLAKAFRNQAPVASPIAIASPTSPANGNIDTNAIAAKVDPAIVDINTVLSTGGQAAGTGMIVTADGEILTNNHVVDGSTVINVIIAGRSNTYRAHVIGVAPTIDIALLQIDGGITGLPTVTLASSSAVKVGDPVVALGNALGQGGTPSLSTGSVTGLNQSITASEGGGKTERLTGMIQSDAPISPGDSGGPLVNAAGQVVGMITAGDVQGFNSQTSTVNYAIPADVLVTYVNKIQTGQASSEIVYGQWGLLGVSVRDLSANAAAQLGLKVTSGALVVTVTPGGPAESAGIPEGSVITKIGDALVTSSDSLGTAIHKHSPGERVTVTWVDSSGTHTATATLIGVNP